MQRIVLAALVLGVAAFSAEAQSLYPDPSAIESNYSRTSLESPYLPERSPHAAGSDMPREAQTAQVMPAQYRGQASQQYQAPAPQYATRRANLGGGFIEFLFSGAEQPQHRPQPVMAPSAGESGPGQIERIYAPSRSAGLPPARTIRAVPEMDPKFLPSVIDYDGTEQAGTIIINTNERYLYLVMDGGKARRYGIGVGRPGFTWAGTHKVTAKREWPDWYPPDEMLKRQPYLPVHMAGGPNNPLGARALYLGSTLYRIHGSNEPWTIGHAVSSGCIRMRNQDVIDLYDRVGVGAKVVVI
jgi:lipoprotein-anchoring transpeptidase ErfK/SrfK